VSNLIRLLDLPDEALALIEAGHLTEGHGRALLTVEDHGIRRALARAAAAEAWSVRELEARARAAARADGPPRRARRARTPRRREGLHPDQEDAMARIGDMLGGALGRELEISPVAGGTGYRVALTFESVDEALDLARRLSVRSVA
jgi:ParB family chromosome partitioning protein